MRLLRMRCVKLRDARNELALKYTQAPWLRCVRCVSTGNRPTLFTLAGCRLKSIVRAALFRISNQLRDDVMTSVARMNLVSIVKQSLVVNI